VPDNQVARDALFHLDNKRFVSMSRGGLGLGLDVMHRSSPACIVGAQTEVSLSPLAFEHEDTLRHTHSRLYEKIEVVTW